MSDTMVFEGQGRIYMAARAFLVENDREMADDWASKFIVPNPAHAWILGKFVEADRANRNKQYFSLGGLQMGLPTIQHAPMNINHSERNIVGAFVQNELIHPTTETADGQPFNAYIESLAAFWKYYFPSEYQVVAKAHDEGQLFFSMESIPREISSIGGSDDSKVYPYDGQTSPTYPADINQRQCEAIWLRDPHFVGGGLIIPPNQPGWSRAETKVIAGFIKERWAEAEDIYNGVRQTAAHLEPKHWETMMEQIVLMSQSERAQ